MQSAGRPESAATSGRKLSLDEGVVHRLLQVNPGMRAGRTTLEVKRDLERGASMGGQAAQARRRSRGAENHGVSAAVDAVASARAELAGTVGALVHREAALLTERLGRLAARRRELDREEAELRRYFVGQVAAAIAGQKGEHREQHLAAALSGHTSFLARFEITPGQILAAARRFYKGA